MPELKDYFEASDKVDTEKIEQVDDQKREDVNQSIETAYDEY